MFECAWSFGWLAALIFASASVVVATAAPPETVGQMLGRVDPLLGSVADRAVPGKAAFSRFRTKSADEHLDYDLGNNAVSASVSARGAIQRALIFTGLSPIEIAWQGVWYGFEYLKFNHDIACAIEIGGKPVSIAASGLRQDTSLVNSAFPLTTVRIDNLKIRQIVLAPVIGKEHQRPRALLIGLLVETDLDDSVSATLIVPEAFRGRAHKGKADAGYAEFCLLDDLKYNDGPARLKFEVRDSKPVWIPVLMLMAETQTELDQLKNRVKKISSEQIVMDTANFFAERTGRITPPDRDDPINSIYCRSVHAQIVALLKDRQGEPVGSSWGSDTSSLVKAGEPNYIWMMDTFYNYLSAGIADPPTTIDGIRFFLNRSIPSPRTYEEDKKRPPTTDDHRIHSLANAVAPIVLAGAYYSLTGNADALRQISAADPASGRAITLHERMNAILDFCLQKRDPNSPMLFESRYLSDGATRGKYHTGSNLFAWYAFTSAARLSREVFNDPVAADKYAGVAEHMKGEILRYCTVNHTGREMFSEGYLAPLLHDGEESGTTIMPFLGFCPADDPRLLAYKQFACTPENPQWDAKAGGFIWDSTITCPGFMTELASAGNEQELNRILHKLYSLTDVDGQWWWWPQERGSGEVVRGIIGKCGWGTGVFLIRFLNTNLGMDWDGPTRRLSIRPFVPWEEFNAEGIVYGSLRLDLAYENTDKVASIRLKHNQDRLSELRITLRAPKETKYCRIVHSSAGNCHVGKPYMYFGKPAYDIVMSKPSERNVSLRVEWTK